MSADSERFVIQADNKVRRQRNKRRTREKSPHSVYKQNIKQGRQMKIIMKRERRRKYCIHK